MKYLYITSPLTVHSSSPKMVIFSLSIFSSEVEIRISDTYTRNSRNTFSEGRLYTFTKERNTTLYLKDTSCREKEIQNEDLFQEGKNVYQRNSWVCRFQGLLNTINVESYECSSINLGSRKLQRVTIIC